MTGHTGRPLMGESRRRLLHTTVDAETLAFIDANTGAHKSWSSKGLLIDDAVALLRDLQAYRGSRQNFLREHGRDGEGSVSARR